MPLGNPIRKQNESRIVSVLATEGQTVFTVQGGYIINQISVFRNGVRLSNSEDFTAGDGSTVTLNNAANIDDRIEFHVFDRFTVQNAIVSAASTQTISGDVVVNGKIFGNLDVPSINTGIVTTQDLNVTGVGTFTGAIDANGGATIDNIRIGITDDNTIDTSSGNLKLSASGDIQINDNVDLNGTLDLDGSATFDNVRINANEIDTTSGNLTIDSAGGTVTVDDNLDVDGTSTLNGVVSIADSIVHTGDTDTSVRFPSADTFTVNTNGSEALRINSSGNLTVTGIGTFSSNFNVGGVPPWTQAGNPANSLSISGNTINGAGLLKLGNGAATTNADFDLARIQIYNGATEVARITGETGDSNNDSGQIMFDTKESGGSLTERLILSREGHLIPSTDSAYDLGTSSTRFRYGYFDALYGDGSNLTGITQTTINNNANNRIITGSGTANTLEAESALTFDGTAFNLTGNANISGTLRFEAGGTGWNTTYARPQIGRQADGELRLGSGSDSSSILTFYTSPSAGGTLAEGMRLDGSGRLMLGTTTEGHAAADELTVASTGSGGITIRTGTSGEGNIYFSDGTSSVAEYRGALTYNQSNDNFTLMTSAVERMRIDSVGALTFTAANNGQIIHSFKNTNSTAGSSAHTIEQWFRFNRSGGGMNHPAAKIISGKEREWIGGASNQDGYLAFHTTLNENGGAERMRITSGGSILIGATSYGGGGTAPALYISNSGGRQVKIHNTSAGTCGIQLTNSFTGQGEDNGPQIFCSGGGAINIANATHIGDGVATHEFYAKNSSGTNKLIHHLRAWGYSSHLSTHSLLNLNTAKDGNGSDYFARGSKNSTQPGGGNDVFWIYEDGDMYNVNGTFSQSSDQKLKENIVDASSQWADFKALKFRKFNFKASTGYQTHTQLGLIAQEVELVSPGLVKNRVDLQKTTDENGKVTETDTGEVTKGIKQSVLYMKGMKALQEAMARIETLEAKVAALEGS